MSERAQILSRIAESYVELSNARRALVTCPERERIAIAQRIVELQNEIDRGQRLLAAQEQVR